jgi:cytochrome b561
MTFRNTIRSWGALSKALHWIIVILIVAQFFIASRAHSLPRGPALIEAWGWHKSIGMTIFMLAVIRLV